MKKLFFPFSILVLLLALLSLSAYAQEKENKNDTDDKEVVMLLKENPDTKAYSYEEVIPYDTTKISKEQAYKNAKQFLQSTMKIGADHLTTDDQAYSQLLADAAMNTKMPKGIGWEYKASAIDFKLKLFFKPGRYKMVIDAVNYHGFCIEPVHKAYSDIRNDREGRKIKPCINEALVSMTTNLKNAVIGVIPSASGSGGNW